jgi:TonB family protein
MPHALLLSPDDQAVSAITGVLEEMSVSCERPLDGVSAAQKLNSQSFDLVLVDCENLPAAKLIFDVCRRGKNGNNPVPIAIVDGRAGLPTAFRLGAELILTKPVSKDQARTTIRTAVGRVRKEPPAAEAAAGLASDRVSDRVNDNRIASAVGAAAVRAAAIAAGVAKEDSSALHTADVSPQLTSFAEPAPSFVSASAAPSTSSNTPALAAGIAAKRFASDPSSDSRPEGKMHETLSSPSRTPLSQGSLLSPAGAAAPVSTPGSVRPTAASPKPALVMKPSDDPVLAELERAEQEEVDKKEKEKKVVPTSVNVQKPAAAQAATEVHARHASSQPKSQPKSQRVLVAAMILVLAGGGFYAAWTYQPEFRAMAQPYVGRLLALVGIALPSVEGTKPATSATQTTLPESKPAVGASQTSATPVSPTGPDSTTMSAPPAASASAGTSTVVTPATSEKSPASGDQSVLVQPQRDKDKDKDKAADSKKDDQADLDSQPVNDSSAIILSSQGAQKRLVRSVQPKYPVTGRSGGAQGTIVLKTVVGADGKVASVRLVEGNASLSRAAMDAVRQWRYRPYMRNGKAQAFQTVVIVDFQRP